MKHPAIKYVVAASLTIALLYLAFRGQNLGEAFAAIEHVRWFPLIAGVLLMFVSHAIRAARWQIVLRPLKQKTSFWMALKATIAGYGMNNIIPRSGELVRPYLMARAERMPMPGVLASVVVERLTDVIALAVLLGFSLAVFHDRIIAAFPMLSGGTIPILIGMVLVLFVFVGLFFSQARTAAVIGFFVKPLPQKYQVRVLAMALDFSRGLQGLDKRAVLPLLLGTTGIWLMYGLSMWVSLQGFNDTSMANISVAGAFLLLTLSGISYTVPTPGGSGTYHYFISQGLAFIFGVPHEIALAYAIITHLLSYVSTTVLGLAILFREGISIGKIQDLEPVPASAALVAK